jgi:DNA polymerase III subunit beta
MEFHIQRNTLLAGMRKTLGIVEKKTTMPILNNVLLRARSNKITIIATDIEITLISHYAAEVLSEGEVTVSAKKLYEMMREIPDGLVTVKKNDGNSLTISCQKAIYRISGMSAEEFPRVAEDEALPLFKLDGKVLTELITKTFFATSTDETRPNLTGACLEVVNQAEANFLRMVATDGHRLAMVTSTALDKEWGQILNLSPKGIIIPRKGLVEIKKLLEENIGDIELGIERNMCVVKSMEVVLKVSLIDAEFPDYHRVIPQEKGIVVTFEKDKILHALKRINVISSEGYGGVVVTLKHNLMVLTFNDPDVGEATDELDVEYSGEEMVVGYNIGYFLNAVEVIDEQNVSFEIGVSNKPSVIRGADNDRYACIVMPLKL